MNLFAKQQNTAVGLDIGKDSIKLVELKRQGQGIKLSKMDSVKMPSLPGGGALVSAQTFKKTITGLFARNRVRARQVVLGIDGQSVFMKFLDVLPVGREKLARTLKYEAQQQIPFSLEEVEWDTYLFAPDKEGMSARRVLLAAVKKDKLAGMREWMKEAGLSPLALEVSSLTIYNCLKFNQDYAEDKLNVALNIGARSTDMLIIEGGKFWMRSFAVGGDNFTEALSKKQAIDFAEAEKIKREMSINPAAYHEVWDSVLKDLQGEVSRSLDYYDFQKIQTASLPGEGAASSKKIDQIILTGGAALMPGLDKALAAAFSCRVRPAEPFKLLQIAAEAQKTIGLSQKALFAQAVGLALRGLGAAFIDVNLLRKSIKAARNNRRKLVYDAGSIILTMSVILGVSAMMREEYNAKRLHLEHLKRQLNLLNIHHPQVNELQNKTALLAYQCGLLQNLAVNRSLWLESLKELSRILPADLWFTAFTGQGSFEAAAGKYRNSLQIEGRAATYEEVNDFVAKLKSSRVFEEVKPISSTFVEEGKDGDTDEVVKFSISMEVGNR